MWYNPIMRGMLSSPVHFFVSKSMMLITYTGRKSGKTYTLPVSYLKQGKTLYTISSRERVWWRNLRGGAQVTLRLKGEDVQAWAESIEDEEQVAANLLRYFEIAPQMANYMNISLAPDGKPDREEVNRLAWEKVIVRSILK